MKLEVKAPRRNAERWRFGGNCVIARDKLAIRTSGSQKRRCPVHLRQTGMSSPPDGFRFERAITSIAIIGAGL